MHKLNLLVLILALTTVFSCQKDDPPVAPPAKTPFEVLIQNDISELTARHAAWLSGENGAILAFRWLGGNDTTQLVIPDFAENTPAPDLTIAKITVAAGNMVSDTTVSLKTYTAVRTGDLVRLRELEYRQTTLFNVIFTNITSLDSIIVPDGLTFARPGWWNNYNGLYQVQHTGQIWLRLRFNGDPAWRYLAFDNVSGDKIETTVDPNILPVEAYPTPIQLPFTAAWKYRVDGVTDAASQRFIPLGDLNRAPGGASPVFDKLEVFEPLTFDPVAPPVVPYSGYRLRLAGTSTEGEGYVFDQFVDKLPAAMPPANFTLNALGFGDNRFAGAGCSADFEALVLMRRNAPPDHKPVVEWEVYVSPKPVVSYLLPDVPTDLGKLFPDLKNYNFSQTVRARAEDYQTLPTYRAVLEKIFANNDPFWQAKGGLIGKEREL